MTEDLLIEEPTAEMPSISLLAKVIEAILFSSERPVSVKELISYCKAAAESEAENPLTQSIKNVEEPDVEKAISLLQTTYTNTERSFDIKENAAGWHLVTRSDYSPWLRQLFPENRPARLSAPAMETLAIIAYRQPVTKADIEAVRGVAVDGVMQTLVDRGLVKIAGRAEIAGRPLLYETTQYFMEHFGIKNLDELPNAGELRRIELPKSKTEEAPKVEEAPQEQTNKFEEANKEEVAIMNETEQLKAEKYQ